MIGYLLPILIVVIVVIIMVVGIRRVVKSRRATPDDGEVKEKAAE